MSPREEIDLAVAALVRARAALAEEVAAQAARVEGAEFGPHGRADVIQAESERLDRLRAIDEQLESSLEDLGQVTSDLEDV
ncbi:MAG: hypothetical protein JKY65_31265 [Planctomycetes bacterium]|nr:hypothetical protein [Planctomycetota bacterium]